MDFIQLSHGSGGEETNKLIEELFFKYLGNEFLLQKNDATTLGKISGEIAMTTDSFVVDPIFFNGGNLFVEQLMICQWWELFLYIYHFHLLSRKD